MKIVKAQSHETLRSGCIWEVLPYKKELLLGMVVVIKMQEQHQEMLITIWKINENCESAKS